MLLACTACSGDVDSTTSTPPTDAPATNAPSTGGDATSTPEETTSLDLSMPITDTLTEISVWMVWGNIAPATTHTDWNGAPGFQAIEEKTNIHVNWTIPSYQSEAEAFSILMVSQDYPDIIENFTVYYTSGIEHAVDNEIAIKLDDVIAQYMPNYDKRVDQAKDRRRNYTTDSGYMAAIYNINSEPQAPWGGQCIRKDWLDDLNMPIPETYDEMYDVLVAFRDQKGATKPMTLDSNGDTMGNAIAGGFGAIAGMMQIDGKVIFGPSLPGFRTYLETMVKWYEEGLIDPDFATSNPFDTSGWFNNNSGYGFGFNIVGTFDSMNGQTTDENYNVIGVKNLVQNKGEEPHFGISYADSNQGAIITYDCEKVDICARWLDYQYSDEGSILVNFGFEGKTYFIDEEGYPTIKTAGVEEFYGGRPFDGLIQTIGPVNGSYYSLKYKGQGLKKTDRDEKSAYVDAGVVWIGNNGDYYISDFVTRTAEESDQYNDIYFDIETILEETIANIIVGTFDISAYDEMMTTIKGMGIDRCVEIQQTAMDRYNNR